MSVGRFKHRCVYIVSYPRLICPSTSAFQAILTHLLKDFVSVRFCCVTNHPKTQWLKNNNHASLLTNLKVNGCFCPQGPALANFSYTYSHLNGQLEACLVLHGLEWACLEISLMSAGVTKVSRPWVTHPEVQLGPVHMLVSAGIPRVTKEQAHVGKHFTSCVCSPCVIGQAKSWSSPGGVNKREPQLQKPVDFDALLKYHPFFLISPFPLTPFL